MCAPSRGTQDGASHGSSIGIRERMHQTEMPTKLQASHQAQLTTGTVPNMAADAADIATRGGSDETPDVIRTAAYEDPALTPKFRDSGIPVAGTTYLLGASKLNGDPAARAWLRVGARLLLRQRPRSAADTGELPRPVEVQAPDGRLLGRLPPGDAPGGGGTPGCRCVRYRARSGHGAGIPARACATHHRDPADRQRSDSVRAAHIGRCPREWAGRPVQAEAAPSLASRD
jgi:hypothetical protein